MSYVRRLPKISYGTAFDFLLDFLRKNDGRSRDSYTSYSGSLQYDLHINDVVYGYINLHTPDPMTGSSGGGTINYEDGGNATPFLEAAWNLVSQGIIIPGSSHRVRPNYDPNGFTLTEFGKEWLKEGEDTINPRRYGEFSRLLTNFDHIYGDVYSSRSQEALNCFRHGNYIASCAMAGASAEAILLKAYASHTGDEEAAMRDMAASGGRGRIERGLFGRLKEAQRQEIQTFLFILKYWRDASAHGLTGAVDQNEAYVALFSLLSLAQAMDKYLMPKTGSTVSSPTSE